LGRTIHRSVKIEQVLAIYVARSVRFQSDRAKVTVFMEDADIEQRFHLMQKEIEATVSLMRDNKLDVMAAIDSIKIELEVLKMYMERFHPGFADSYPKFREEAIQAIDPEWMGSQLAKSPGGR